MLSKEKKNALSIIYGFCRLADDIVDEGYEDAPARLAALRAEIDLVFEGRAQTELGAALQEVIKNFPMPKQYFTDLIDGMSRDLQTPVRFAAQADLDWYIYRVASVVGLMCIEIFGYKNQQTKEFAINLGFAVQLTNIARDIAEDGKLNRIYIPTEDLARFGVSEAEIIHPQKTEKLEALIRYELSRAQNYYDNAAKLLPKEDFASMLPARAMGNIYKEILKKLQQNPCPSDGKKLKLNKPAKILVLFKTWREKP